MTSMADDVVVTNSPDEKRYEARLDGALAGFAEYQLTDELIVFTHTEVDPEFEGRGVGGALARHALDEVAAEGTRTVVPRCPFFRAWIRRHPEYRPLVRGPAAEAADG